MANNLTILMDKMQGILKQIYLGNPDYRDLRAEFAQLKLEYDRELKLQEGYKNTKPEWL